MVGLLLICMVFCHIIADFNLQGMLGDLKQKEWWQKNYPEEKYEMDYWMALALHSFEWSFCVCLPVMIFMIANGVLDDYHMIVFVIVFNVNVILHFIIDHLKCNKRKLSLYTDQYLHYIQIGISFLVFVRTDCIFNMMK